MVDKDADRNGVPSNLIGVFVLSMCIFVSNEIDGTNSANDINGTNVIVLIVLIVSMYKYTCIRCICIK